MITQNDLTKMSDEELLDLVKKAKGHTGTDFKEFCSTDFAYTTLLNELRARGYENGWYKQNGLTVSDQKKIEFIYLEDLDLTNGETKKTSFDVSSETLLRWRKMTSAMAHKGRILEIAMIRFLDALDAGEIDFRWKR